MQSKVLAAAILFALGFCVWFTLHVRRAPTSPPVSAHAAPTENDADAAQPTSVLNAPSAIDPTSTRTGLAADVSVPPTPNAQPSPTTDATIVRGRLVDQAGKPIAGVLIDLMSADGSWADGIETPSIRIRGHEANGYQVASSADGRFELRTPVPTANWVSLYVESTAYYGIAGREFGPAGGRNQPRLLRGANELGDFVLPTTGAVKGRVVSADGSNVTKARVALEDHFPGGYGIVADVDAEGTFELGHVPAGTWTLGAQAKGWLVGKIQGVRVENNATTGGVEFRLERSPTISGIAVDEAGVPQADVDVWGWPVGSGRGCGAKTNTDGTFTIFLAQNEPHVLEVQRQSAYEPWGGHGSTGATFEAGRNDVRIVLKHASRFTFRVIDAATDKAIERFGIAIERRPREGEEWNRFSEAPRIEEHSDGTVEENALPGQQEVGIVAAGYAPLEAVVAPDQGSSSVQTLRLLRGGTISGRVALQDRPLANADVRLQGDRVKVDPALPDDEDEMFDDNKRLDVSALAGRKQQLAADSEGAIHIDGLATGTYRLTISGGGAARREVRGIVIKQGETTELGRIQMEPGSTIRGRIVLGPGRSPAGLELRLDNEFDRTTKVSAPDGSFSFQGVEPGEHTVTLEPAPPMVIQYESRTVAVTPGSSPEVVFDLAASAPCAVELRVFRDGRPATGVSARWFVTEEGRETGGSDLGKADDQGVVHGSCPGGSSVRFEVKSPAGLRLARSQAAVSLAAGGSHSERIDIKVGTLVLVLPSSLDVPEIGYVQVLLRPKTEGDDERFEVVQCHTLRSPFRVSDAPSWEGHRVELGEVSVGEFHASVRTFRSEKQNSPETNNWMSIEIGSPFDGDIKVEAGKAATIEVP